MSKTKLKNTRLLNDPSDRSVLRKSERTRQAILDAALEFLWSSPFRDLTIAGLMAQTPISRPVFYQYFADLHELMENLLFDLEQDVQAVAQPWFSASGDPVPQLANTLNGVVNACYRRGPILRSIVEAAPLDERLERAWNEFVKVFDDAVTTRIEQDQAAGVVSDFDARPVAIALNRMNVGTLIQHFGRRPRSRPKPVYLSIARVWISSIYGQQAVPQLGEL